MHTHAYTNPWPHATTTHSLSLSLSHTHTHIEWWKCYLSIFQLNVLISLVAHGCLGKQQSQLQKAESIHLRGCQSGRQRAEVSALPQISLLHYSLQDRLRLDVNTHILTTCLFKRFWASPHKAALNKNQNNCWPSVSNNQPWQCLFIFSIPNWCLYCRTSHVWLRTCSNSVDTSSYTVHAKWMQEMCKLSNSWEVKK